MNSVRSAWLLNRTDAGGGQTRTDTRLAPLGTMAPSGVLGSRDGVIPGSQYGKYVMDGLYVYGDQAGMTGKVAPGRAVVQSTEQAGAYPVTVTDYVPLLFADGDANNPRVDLVVVRVYDAQQDTSNRTEAVIEIVQGVPGATPATPPTPAGALALAEVTVPAGASAGKGGINWDTAVRDRRRATVAVGGIIPRGWGLNFPGAYPGQYRDTGTGLERWDGAQWKAYPEPRPTWQDYTPQWGADNGPVPRIGNGSLTGRYLHDGALVHFTATLKTGSTTNWGGAGKNGNWWLSLPVRPTGPSISGHLKCRLSAGYYHGGCYLEASRHANGSACGWTANNTDGGTNGGWADGDWPESVAEGNWFTVWGSYEASQ
ncbi:hypothetical protein AB0A70_10005 [Streptomyces morookaense]|uniref:hypothetical protein n=1 Tax=Streptomyces morookaense TaxID=1970 RepID=UPI0033D74C43